MTKDVIFSIPTQVEPYRTYYAERNGNIARYLADILGFGFLGLVEQFEGNNKYIVPPKTITMSLLKEIGIRSEANFYGLAISDIDLVDKQIFQLGRSQNGFAGLVREYVLNGYKAKGKNDLKKAVETMLETSGEARIKKLGVSDGRGQRVVENSSKIGLLECSDDEVVVVEPNLVDKSTISVGRAIVGSNEYSFIAHQINDVAPEDGRDRYMGANPVRVVRGDLYNLFTIKLQNRERIAVAKAIGFDKEYLNYYKPLASRISYDVLFGRDRKGNNLSGITDITGRLGGTCPALVLAIKDILEDAREIFVDHPTLKISAELL